MAFFHQYSLHPLPLTDLNLCRFVSVLHNQQLSPSSIRLYLSSLRFLQISSGGRDPCFAEFPRLHYVIRAVITWPTDVLLGSQLRRPFYAIYMQYGQYPRILLTATCYGRHAA